MENLLVYPQFLPEINRVEVKDEVRGDMSTWRVRGVQTLGNVSPADLSLITMYCSGHSNACQVDIMWGHVCPSTVLGQHQHLHRNNGSERPTHFPLIDVRRWDNF